MEEPLTVNSKGSNPPLDEELIPTPHYYPIIQKKLYTYIHKYTLLII